MGSLTKKIKRSMREQVTGKRMAHEEFSWKVRVGRKLAAQREATRIKFEKEAEERFPSSSPTGAE